MFSIQLLCNIVCLICVFKFAVIISFSFIFYGFKTQILATSYFVLGNREASCIWLLTGSVFN
jgi:hypothetical protein